MVAAERLGLAFSSARIPLLLFPVHAFLLGAIHDAVFYAGHRLLHTRLLFPLHRLHHRSTGAVAASSLYMSPLDFVAEIVLPYGAFLCLIQSDVRFDVLLASAGSLLAMYEHSGYCFTFFKVISLSSSSCDWHFFSLSFSDTNWRAAAGQSDAHEPPRGPPERVLLRGSGLARIHGRVVWHQASRQQRKTASCAAMNTPSSNVHSF